MEPPGLFRGRGEHPKMGLFKRRIYPRDITINIGALPPDENYRYSLPMARMALLHPLCIPSACFRGDCGPTLP